jgi:DNA repair exonuclease SbcCD ATPase subunit
MTDNLNITPETALKTLYTNLYPSVSKEHLPTLDPTPLEETHIDFINNPAVSAARHKFLTSWKASVKLETSYQAEIIKAAGTTVGITRVTQLTEERKEAHKETTNNLNLYVYIVIKDRLEPPGAPLVTPESIQVATRAIKEYIKSFGGEEESVQSLIQLLHTVHGKPREFTTELVSILQREALLQHAKLSKANTDLVKKKEKLERRLKLADKKLEDITVNNEKVEQLKKDYTLNITTLSSCEQQIVKLQGELKEARELAVQLDSAADSNSQVETLQLALKEKIEPADQLKTALESKQRENKALEENSLEANNDLEESIKQHEVTITSLKKQCQTLQGENTSLQQELQSTIQLNNQINEKKTKPKRTLTQSSFRAKRRPLE